MKIKIKKLKPRDPNEIVVGKWFHCDMWNPTKDCYEIHEIVTVQMQVTGRTPISHKEVVTKYEGKNYNFRFDEIKIIPYGTPGYLFRRSGGNHNQY